MSRRLAPLLLLLILFPPLCTAREVILDGTVTTTGDDPVAGAEVTLLEPSGIPGATTRSGPDGRFRLRLQLSNRFHRALGYVTLHLEAPGLYPQDAVVPCALASAARCPDIPIEMPALAGDGNPGDDLGDDLEPLPPGEYALLLSPYEMLPADSPVSLDSRLFAATLRRAINTHLNELGATPEALRFDPLPPVDMVTTARPLASERLGRRSRLGRRLGVLAVVSGLGEWNGARQRITLNTEFLLISPDPQKRGHLLTIVDPDLPAERVNSLALADQVSPLWQRYSLVALAERELDRATRDGDREALERIYAYVVAERGRLGPEEQVRAAELERLRRRIDEALGP